MLVDGYDQYVIEILNFQKKKVILLKKLKIVPVWRHMPLIPAFGRQRQEVSVEFEASLVSIASSRAARATQRDSISK